MYNNFALSLPAPLEMLSFICKISNFPSNFSQSFCVGPFRYEILDAIHPKDAPGNDTR